MISPSSLNYLLKRAPLLLAVAFSHSTFAVTESCIVNALLDEGEDTLTLEEALEAECQLGIIIDDSLAGKTIEIHSTDDYGDVNITGPEVDRVTIVTTTTTNGFFPSRTLKLTNLILDGQEKFTGGLDSGFIDTIELNNVMVKNNHGGLIHSYYGDFTILDSQFINNQGRLFFLYEYSGAIVNSLFENNHELQGGCSIAEMQGSEGYFEIRNSIFRNNSAKLDGGVLCGNFDATGNIFEYNHSDGNGGAVAGHLYLSSLNGEDSQKPTVFNHNTAGGKGGAIFGGISGHPIIYNNNTAGTSGGAIFMGQRDRYNSSNGYIKNSTFYGNTASEDGGAVYVSEFMRSIDIHQSTFYENNSLSGAGAVHFENSEEDTIFNLTHSTLVANTSEGNGASAIVFSDNINIVADISHSVFIGGNGSICNLSTNGSVSIDYSFMDDSSLSDSCLALIDNGGNLLGHKDTQILDAKLNPASDTGGGMLTFYPKADSPLIDAGNSQIIEPTTTDQRGYERIIQSTIDIGAVEYGNYKPLIVSPLENLEVIAGKSVSLNTSLVFSTFEQNSLTYSIKGFPLELRINEESGKITGKVNELGSFDAQVLAKDNWGNSTTANFNLLVTNNPPTAETIEAIELVAGIHFEIDLDRYFFDDDDHTIQYSISSLPESFNIDETSGLLTGVANEVEEYSGQILASDGWSQTNTPISFIVKNTPPIFPNLRNMIVTVGEEIDWDIASLFSDDDGHPLTIEINGIPNWLNLESGIVRGFAGESVIDKSYTINISVSDGFSTLTPSVNLTVTPKQEDDDGDDIIEGIGSLYYISILLSFITIYRKRSTVGELI